jgi:hypothetical protein
LENCRVEHRFGASHDAHLRHSTGAPTREPHQLEPCTGSLPITVR